MAVLSERLTSAIPRDARADRGEAARAFRAAKRVADVFIALAGTLLTALLFPLIAIAQAIDGPGPVLYRQVRVGKNGRHFVLYKFRSMRPDAEAGGPQWAAESDGRTIRVGRLLRRLHLDEVPQSINILRGEMSFIGPRPERPEFVQVLEQEFPSYCARHAVLPGVTGWAQVNYHYGASVGDALVKLRYDLYYVNHASLSLDLVILARTPSMVLNLEGR